MNDSSRTLVACSAVLLAKLCLRPMGHALPVLAATLLCVAALPLGAAQRVDTQSMTTSHELNFDPATGRLSGRVEAGAEIGPVITRIGELADFETHLQAGLGELRSPVNLDDLTVEGALRILTRDYSTVILHGGPGKAATEVSKVWVIGEGEQSERGLPTPVVYPQLGASERGGYSPDVARAASVRDIIKLANKADEESISQLHDLAVNAEDPALRRSAMSSLAGIAGVESYELFVYSGLNDPDVTVRIEAARSVMRVGSEGGTEIVEAAAQRETDASARDIMERLAKGETVDRNTGVSTAKPE